MQIENLYHNHKTIFLLKDSCICIDRLLVLQDKISIRQQPVNIMGCMLVFCLDLILSFIFLKS